MHPRMLTYFLGDICPAFTEEVLDIFHRFVTGDPTLAQDSASIRESARAEERKAAENDLLLLSDTIAKQKAEILEANAKLTAISSENARLVADLDTHQANVEARIADMKAHHKEDYEALVKQKDARDAEIAELLMKLERSADSLELAEEIDDQHMQSDTGRPLNVFRDMDIDSIPNSNRHTDPGLWFASRHITVDACIYTARKNFSEHVEMVIDRFHTSKILNAQAKSGIARMLRSRIPRMRSKARRAIKKMYRSLKSDQKEEVTRVAIDATAKMFREVFAIQPDEGKLSLKHTMCNVSMYKVLCKYLKFVYDVKFSTEIDTKYLAKMALNLQAFTNGAFTVPLNGDYTEVLEDLADVQLIEYL